MKEGRERGRKEGRERKEIVSTDALSNAVKQLT